MTRDEHIAWCKRRALEYFDRGDLISAVTSMMADMYKHSETKLNDFLVMDGINALTNDDREHVKRWIEGFR